ncbi:MAG: type III-A CRISPR-associated protein Csm2 [Parafilimonas sp.]
MNEIKYWHKKKDPNLNKEWISKGITSDAIKWAELFGHYLADEFKRDETGKAQTKMFNGKLQEIKATYLTTSQLRKFFGEVRRIQNIVKTSEDNSINTTDILLLKPRLAYQVGREKDKEAKIKDFYTQISIALDTIENKQHFMSFIRLLEAIVAYHKEIEPKKN